MRRRLPWWDSGSKTPEGAALWIAVLSLTALELVRVESFAFAGLCVFALALEAIAVVRLSRRR